MKLSPEINYADRIPGIDRLKAFMSIAVVVWHMGSFGDSFIFNSKEYGHHVFTLTDLIKFHVLLLAVPSFFITSCYLYVRKPRSTQYLNRRIIKLAALAVFWTVAGLFVFLGGVSGLSTLIPDSLPALGKIILSAGNTAYYFFISLIILTIISHFFSRFSTPVNTILFVFTCVIVFYLPKVTIKYSFGPASAFWNPLNFFPYPFAAILMARSEKLLSKPKVGLFVIAILLSAAVALAVYEWQVYVNGVFFPWQHYGIPPYTRLSIVCSSTLIFFAAMKIETKPGRIVDFMSAQSLALYCVHPYFIALAKLLPFTDMPWSPYLTEILKLGLVLINSYIAALLALTLRRGAFQILYQRTLPKILSADWWMAPVNQFRKIRKG